MRKLRWAIILYSLFDLFIGGYCAGFLPLQTMAAAQTTLTLASGGVGVSCNAVTASTSNNPGTAGGCTSFNLLTSGGSLPSSYTFQVSTTGSPTSISVTAMGSLDNVNWTTLGTIIAAGSGTYTGAYRFLGCIPGTLSGGTSPTLTCQISVTGGGGGGGGALPSNIYQVTSNGFACNGNYSGGGTDDTTALNALMTTVNSAGGGTLVFPPGKICLFNSAEITLPNNGDSWTDAGGSISSQAPIRWTCGLDGQVQFQQLMSSGATVSQIQNACVINDTFNATDAKFVTLGMGMWEIDHIAFIDTSTDCASFFLFTNTQPFVHDNAIIGSTKSVTSGPYSCNDGFVLGGGTTTPGKGVTAPFQGYAGAAINHNFFNQIQRAVNMKDFANTIMVQNNTVWSQSGCSTCGAFELNGTSALGNYGDVFAQNNVEVVHYLYGFNVANANQNATMFLEPNCSDAAEFSTICVNNTAGALATTVIGGTNAGSSGTLLASSDVTTYAILPFTTGPWPSTIHWPGFLNLIEQSGTANCTVCDNLWPSSVYQRLVMNNHNAGLTPVAGLSDLPTTKVSTASDNFTRANAATLGANWTAINSLTSLQIVSNKAEANATAAYNGNFYSNITFPADQWSQCTLSAITSKSNSYTLCAVRVQSGAESFYALMLSTDGASFCSIRKFTAGATSDLVTCTGNILHAPLAAADQFTLTVVGSTLTGYMNGKQIATTTDTSFTAGSPGILAFDNTAVTDVVYSGWSGGSMDCAGAATSIVPGLPIVCGGPIAPVSSGAITIGSGTSISATSLCSTAQCPAGRYQVNVYIDITTACTTTGSYIPWLGWTDDAGAKTGSSTTTYFSSAGGLGVTPATASAGATLALASTSNFLTGTFILSTTGAATSSLGSINYGTTATACGTGGPMVGKMYFNVVRLE